MAVLSLRTASYRNLVDKKINTAGKEVFLVGENGQGKTNFLEAIYFCSYGSSFRGTKDKDLAYNSHGDFSVSASLGSLSSIFEKTSEQDLNTQITIKFENKAKSIKLDQKKIVDRKDLLEINPCVAFCHEDMEFVYGNQERRRWFFDQTQSLYDYVYLDDFRRYRRVLKTRNTILRQAKLNGQQRESEELLSVLDPQLMEYGFRLMEKRMAAAERFSEVFSPLYNEVSGIAGISVSYEPSWKNRNRLADCRVADLTQGTTVSGPHRDKYFFIKNNPDKHIKDFSETASTGQTRLLALLLRVAQARCFTTYSCKMPVLLLDDVLLELDGEKRRRFLSVMPDYEQAFFTFLPEEPYQNYIKSDTLLYKVSSGNIIG